MTIRTALLLVLAPVGIACAQTHVYLSTDQNFTSATGHPLTGTYQCTTGTIDGCGVTNATLTNPIINGTVSGTAMSDAASSKLASYANPGSVTIQYGQQIMLNASGQVQPTGYNVGAMWWAATSLGAVSTSASTYIPLSGAGQSATETDVAQFAQPGRVVYFVCQAPTAAPGGGKSYQIKLRDQGAASDTGVGCTISGTDQGCADAVNTYKNTASTRFDLKVTPSGTPTATAITCNVNYNSCMGLADPTCLLP